MKERVYTAAKGAGGSFGEKTPFRALAAKLDHVKTVSSENGEKHDDDELFLTFFLPIRFISTVCARFPGSELTRC